MAALQFLKTLSKVSLVHFFFFLVVVLALPSCALLLLVQKNVPEGFNNGLFWDNTHTSVQVNGIIEHRHGMLLEQMLCHFKARVKVFVENCFSLFFFSYFFLTSLPKGRLQFNPVKCIHLINPKCLFDT